MMSAYLKKIIQVICPKRGKKMQTIRDSFINKIALSAQNSVGATTVLQLGINEHAPIATQFPNSSIKIGVGHPTSQNARAISFSPTHKQTQNILQNNRNILFELYLTEIVQHWFDFLSEIYERALSSNLSGNSGYTLEKIRISTVDFSSLTALKNSAIKSAVDDFDFLRAAEKTKIIKKILNITFSQQEEKDIAVIKTNIQVRNILQHNGGIVKQKDIDELGTNHIEQDEGNTITRIVAGQKITRTAFDIEKLVSSMIKIANVIIP